jgi:hypothetical protein
MTIYRFYYLTAARPYASPLLIPHTHGVVPLTLQTQRTTKCTSDVRLMGERGEAGGVQYVLLGGEK